MEANYFQNRDQPTPEQISFWLREMRTSRLLIDVARRFPAECEREFSRRPLLGLATCGDEAALAAALGAEEQQEREADRAYWAPLKQELESLGQRGADGG